MMHVVPSPSRALLERLVFFLHALFCHNTYETGFNTFLHIFVPLCKGPVLRGSTYGFSLRLQQSSRLIVLPICFRVARGVSRSNSLSGSVCSAGSEAFDKFLDHTSLPCMTFLWCPSVPLS